MGSFHCGGMDMYHHLILQRNNSHYLLIQYPDRYHIISVNRKLEFEVEEWILANYCTDAELDQFGLTRETIQNRELRGVAVGGHTAGSVLVLYQGMKKHKFILSDDYEEAYIDDMFAGFERYLAPQDIGVKSPNVDWRKEFRDPDDAKKMDSIGTVVNVIGVAYLLLNIFLSDGGPIWFLGGIAITVISLFLYLSFPQYYSLMDDKMYKKAGYKTGVTHLHFAVFFPVASITLSALMRFTVLNLLGMLIWGIFFGALITVLIYCFSREMRECAELVVVVALFFLLGGYGLAVNANHLLNLSVSEPQAYVVTEKEYRSNRKGPDSYECIIILDNGSELELEVKFSVYRDVDVGDEILAYVGKGALGIEYAYFIDFGD